MICPMTFSNPETFHHGGMECDPNCAWLVQSGVTGDTYCAVAVIASSGIDSMGFSPVNIMDDEAKGGE